MRTSIPQPPGKAAPPVGQRRDNGAAVTTEDIRRLTAEAITSGVAIARRIGWLEGRLSAFSNPPGAAEREQLQAELDALNASIAGAASRLPDLIYDLGESVTALTAEAGHIRMRLAALDGAR